MQIPKINLIVRCSSLYKIMTKSRSKSDPLSETAKSYIMEQAKEQFYGIEISIDNKYTQKGHLNENQAIEMINQSRFRTYEKNVDRKSLDWITGECDINAEDRIIDVKCSWSFDTFPAFNIDAEKMAKRNGYDWQMRGYMLLYDQPMAEIVWCMTSTPDNLLSPYDDKIVHKVDHIEPVYRMTSYIVNRDLEIEQEMINQYKVANDYYKQCILELKNKSNYKWN